MTEEMIVHQLEIEEYLKDYKDGKIEKGATIGIKSSDDFIRFNKGSFNMILGHDNVGKTYWRLWYYLVLSVQHNYTWTVWTGENKPGQVVRDLVKALLNKPMEACSKWEVIEASQKIANWFTFVTNKKLHKYKDLLNIFEDQNTTGCIIDPYTGLDRKFGHSDNYEFLNTSREWVNRTNITLDVCTHPATASGRAAAMYPQGHIWEGCLRAPYKADIEGGKPFGNRADDFYIVHRLTDHASMFTKTMVTVNKVKDTELGGKPTVKDEPVFFDYNNGCGFTIDGYNPIFEKEEVKTDINYTQKPLTVNEDFEDDLPF